MDIPFKLNDIKIHYGLKGYRKHSSFSQKNIDVESLYTSYNQIVQYIFK